MNARIEYLRPQLGTAQPRWFSAAAVVAVHLLALLALWWSRPALEHRAVAAPLTVSLIDTVPRSEVAEPKPQLIPPGSVVVPQIRPVMIAFADTPQSVERVEVASTASTLSSATERAAPLVPPSFDAAYLNNPGPRYPPTSRKLREEGEVLLRVLVRSDGSAERVEIEHSSGFFRLDAAAAEVVAQRWHFVAARQNGQPVAAWVLVPVRFELR
ncbi:MAG: TonB family protein [Steroidobacteraceae bacterium]